MTDGRRRLQYPHVFLKKSVGIKMLNLVIRGENNPCVVSGVP